MSQSLYTAMGGISAATKQLSVISNNVANINTTAFKSSSVQFSDVYSTTLSYGSVATSTSGGTNPIQIGVGTQVSAVSTDFNTGSWNSTGKSTDLMINGQGFFSVQATDGTTYYTRAGNFSIDESGNLVTSGGYKVLGTDTNLATTSSNTTVKIPTSITAIVTGTDFTTAVGASTKVTSLNGTKSTITSGNFNISLTHGATTTTATVKVNADGTVQDMVDSINGSLPAGVTCSISADGKLSLKTTDPTDTLSFTTPTTGSSNFLTQTGIGSVKVGTIPTVLTNSTSTTTALTENKTLTVTDSTTGAHVDIPLDGTTTAYTTTTLAAAINSALSSATPASDIRATVVGGTLQFKSAAGDTVALSGGSSLASGTTTGTVGTGTYTSGVLDESVHVTDLTSKSTSANSETINADGSLEVTYKDGSTLSVEQKTDGTYGFIFTSSDSIKIDGTKCAVDSSVAEPSNFVIQMATVTNTEGLLSVGNNLYSAGPNTGDIVYTVAGEMGCAKVASGGLEASNVDLSAELSNMILAQRAVQANSRVFTTTTDIMNTINQMGQ